MRSTLAAGGIGLGLLAPIAASAHGEGRSQTLAFYGPGPFVDGDITFGRSGEGDIDVDADDIIDSLGLAAT